MARHGSSLYFLFKAKKMRISTNKHRGAIAIAKKRILYVSIGFLLFLSLLITNLLKLELIGYEKYQNKVYDQITTTSKLRAERGNIYDSNMSLLATTKTCWRIFVSTRDIKLYEKESDVEYSKLIASGLSSILDISYDKLLQKIKGTSQLDVTIKSSADEKEYNRVIDFINKNSLEKMIFTEAQSTRYYPERTLAAHVLGFTGSDNQGLYGLEYYYDKTLKGVDGYYLYAKDANGNALDTEYTTYTPAKDGNSIVTTIDSYVQRTLESKLESIVLKHSVQNRATGIVMDVETGAILAMATTSPFDPNAPYTLDERSMQKLYDSGFSTDSDEYKAYKKELLEIMWSNKAVSETYEPGSTFKLVTVSAALDSGAVTLNDKFSCSGFYKVGGWRIKCHKITGHGSGFSIAYGLQMSCNPSMMQIAERIGVDSFYDYVERFGYFEKSGIDLPSEAATIFHQKENIGPTELATISFGQRFKVSIINHLTAICAVANGGNLITPYLVDKVIDSEGNIISSHKTEVRGRVISEEVSATVSTILEEGVSGNGGAKNAYVEGYKIAAKTGTSQKFDVLDANGNSYLRIASTVAYAPSDGGGIAVIIVVDEPMSTVKYGSVVAAPYVSELLEDILPYLEYPSENERITKEVPNLIGCSVDDAINILKEKSINYEIIGSGDTVIMQSPSALDEISSDLSVVFLYTETISQSIQVPSLVGLDISKATELALEAGLNISIKGARSGTVTKQSLPNGAFVNRGEVIVLNIIATDFED